MPFIRNLAKRALKRATRAVQGSERPAEAAQVPSAPASSPTSPRPVVPSAPPSPRAPADSGPGTAPRFASLDELHAAVFGPGQLRLVNHWATWCSGCVDELSLLVALHEAVGSEVEFLGVSWEGFDGGLLGEDLLDEVQAASTIHGLRWPSLLIEAPPPEFFDRFNLDCQTIPQVWLVDGEGTVLHRIEQALEPIDVDDLKDRIAEALKPAGK